MRDGMMDCEDVVALIDEIRRLGSELDDVETKAAQGGLPARIYRSLSALSNRRGGGVILLGVDEEQRFAVVGVADVARLQQELASVASEMRPPLRLDFNVCEVEGRRVVAVQGDEDTVSRGRQTGKGGYRSVDSLLAYRRFVG